MCRAGRLWELRFQGRFRRLPRGGVHKPCPHPRAPHTHPTPTPTARPTPTSLAPASSINQSTCLSLAELFGGLEMYDFNYSNRPNMAASHPGVDPAAWSLSALLFASSCPLFYRMARPLPHCISFSPLSSSPLSSHLHPHRHRQAKLLSSFAIPLIERTVAQRMYFTWGDRADVADPESLSIVGGWSGWDQVFSPAPAPACATATDHTCPRLPQCPRRRWLFPPARDWLVGWLVG